MYILLQVDIRGGGGDLIVQLNCCFMTLL